MGIQSLKPAVHESCDKAGRSNGFEYQITWILKGSEIKASGAGRAKKDARKIAVKNLLLQVGPVSTSVSLYKAFVVCVSCVLGRAGGLWWFCC